MSYYNDALIRIKNYQHNFLDSEYKYCVALCCEAADRLLKEKLEDMDKGSVLLVGHDFIGIYKALQKRYPSKTNLIPHLQKIRKYFNDSRYSGSESSVDPQIYTKEFAEEMYSYTMLIKDYIDNECSGGLQGLVDKFK